ncbi:CaiF/GrlA family transcriptional regulator [Enterobacteriaceae bacterium LUAb1]
MHTENKQVLPAGTALATEEKASQGKSRKVTGKQGNHGGYHLPECLAHMGSPTLWLAVACWGQMCARPVSREDIAQAFRISPRRAADVMTYILSDHSDVVKVEKTVDRVGSGHRQARFRILDVTTKTLSAVVKVKKNPAVLVGNSQEREAVRRQEAAALAQARALFLMRRTVPSTV